MAYRGPPITSPDIIYGSSEEEEETPRGSPPGPNRPTMEHAATPDPNAARNQNEAQARRTVTSTPLLTTRKQFMPQVLEDLNLTAIQSDAGSSVLNMTMEEEEFDPPTSPLPATRRKLKQIIESDDSEEELTKVGSAGKSRGSTDSGTETQIPDSDNTKKLSEDSVHELSILVDSLHIEKAPLLTTPKKLFNFKPPSSKPASPSIQILGNTDDEQENRPPNEFTISSDTDDEIVHVGTSGPKSKTVLASIDLEDTDVARRVPVPVPKPRSTKFLAELPSSSVVSAMVSKPFKTESGLFVPELGPSFQVIPTENRDAVSKAIQKLLDTIETIPKETDLAEDPPGLRTGLYDHQKYGLQWLWWREHNFPGGGILADEMGLGKTVMILALILKSKAEGRPDYKKKRDDGWLSATKSALVPSRATLIIVPPGVLGQWESEIKAKAKNMSVILYHGPRRDKLTAAVLSRHDVVLSTYQTVLYDIPKDEDRYHCSSPLIRVDWERVVLDEGHYIRNEKTHAASSVCKLNALHRWVVTGTPVHNKPADLHSLIKFLRLEPFDDPKLWDYWIGLKTVSKIKDSTSRLNTIGKALILRRTKADVSDTGGDVPSIPPKTVKEVVIVLPEQERKVYDHLNQFAEAQFRMFLKGQKENELQKASDNYVAGGRGRKPPPKAADVNYTHIFTLILRLRQCAVAPYLIHSMIEDEEGEDLDDSLTPKEDDVISKSNPLFAANYKSAKLIQLYEDIEKLRVIALENGKPMDKVVVVSQWTTLLDIIDKHLLQMGYSTCTISGKVKISDRMDVMNKFNTKPKRPQVMLLSLAAGGCGLNLIGANHLFLLDIHWNPQMELQAQDRVHRFGQTKEVTIYRYVTESTIEQRVVALQQDKLELAAGLLSNSKKAAGGGLTIKEMRQLFDI